MSRNDRFEFHCRDPKSGAVYVGLPTPPELDRRSKDIRDRAAAGQAVECVLLLGSSGKTWVPVEEAAMQTFALPRAKPRVQVDMNERFAAVVAEVLAKLRNRV